MNEKASTGEKAADNRKPWVAPAVEKLDVGDRTQNGGITDIIENGFYHT